MARTGIKQRRKFYQPQDTNYNAYYAASARERRAKRDKRFYRQQRRGAAQVAFSIFGDDVTGAQIKEVERVLFSQTPGNPYQARAWELGLNYF